MGSGGLLYVAVCEKVEVLGLCEEGGSVVDVFGGGAFFAGAVTGGVSGARSGAVTLNGVVRGVANAEGTDLPLTECDFEYVSEEAYRQSVGEDKGGFSSGEVKKASCAPDLVGESLQEKNFGVSAEVTEGDGLVAGRVYRYRLVAATPSGAEHGGVSEGAAESFAAPDEPVVEDVSVGDVSSASADFHVTIDPRGEDTSYQVQYVPASAYDPEAPDPYAAAGGGVVPASAAAVGAGDVGVSVSVQAGGLSAGTAYDYRVVASNGIGVADGVNGVFSTAPGVVPGLADGRVYELVTPPNKQDAENLFGGPPDVRASDEGEAGTNYDRGVASEDGEHFLLTAAAAFGSFPASYDDAYVFSRGADGWSFQSVASPSLGVQSAVAEIYDPLNFSAVGVNDEQRAGHGLHQLFNLVGPAGGPYRTIESGANGSSAEAHMVGASTDLDRVVLQSGDSELAPAPNEEKQDPGSEALYESGAGEGLRLANVGPAGELLKCGAILGQDGGEDLPEGGAHGAVSGDGSRVIFTAPDPFGSTTSFSAVLAAGTGRPATRRRCMSVRTGKRRWRFPRPKGVAVPRAVCSPRSMSGVEGRVEGVLHDQDGVDEGSRRIGAARPGAV